MTNQRIIVGAFNEVIELAEDNGLRILGLFDAHKTGEYRGYPILGTDEQAVEFTSRYKDVPLIVTPDQPLLREQLHQHYFNLGYTFTELIAKDAKISKSAIVKKGSIIQSSVNVSSECNIEEFVKLNTNCNIMHNVTIGQYTTVAPNAVILGYVKIGARCYLGANATILPNISVADNVVIGAGAVVTKSIYKPGVYVGCPAKLLK